MDRLVLKLFDRLCQANIILAMQEQERGDSLLPFKSPSNRERGERLLTFQCFPP